MSRFLPILLLAMALCLSGCGQDESQVPPKVSTATSKGGNDGGSSRINVKRGTDPDAASISTDPKDITVEDLLATKLPDGVTDVGTYDDKRIGEFEKSTFRVTGNLKSVVQRKDGDYFLVMEGKSGATAVIEVPDPKLTQGSPLQKNIQATRTEIENRYHPTDKVKEINEPATIEGVGFYGTRSKSGSSGKGSSPRLMPGTGFKGGK